MQPFFFVISRLVELIVLNIGYDAGVLNDQGKKNKQVKKLIAYIMTFY